MGRGTLLLIPFQRSDVACAGSPCGSYKNENMLFELIFPMEGREKGIKGVSVRGRDQIFFEEVLKQSTFGALR